MQTRSRSKKEEEFIAACNLDELIRHHKRNSKIYQAPDLIGKSRQLPDPNKQEEMLEILWKVLSDVYFKRIEPKDTKVLEYILETFMKNSEEVTTLVPIFRDSESISAVAKLIGKQYEKVYGDFHIPLGYHNFINMLKNYFLTLTYYMPLLEKKKSRKFVVEYGEEIKDYLESKYNFPLMKNKGPDMIKEYLDNESDFLDEEIKKTNLLFSPKDLGIDKKIEQLQSQVYLLNLSNRQQLENLCENMMSNPKQVTAEMLHDVPESSKIINDMYKQDGISTNIQRIYLRTLIFEIEEAQIAESIKQLGEVFVNEEGDEFCEVWLEDCILKDPFFIEMPYLQKLDKRRDKSLLGIYHRGTKSVFPYVSHNRVGLKYSRSQKFKYFKGIERVDFMSQEDVQSHNLERTVAKAYREPNTIMPMMMCHHCKMLCPFHEVYSCMNRISNKNIGVADIVRRNLIGLKDSVSDRCSRIYCRKCLKMWYGDDLKKFKDHRSFICHFCNEDCCCSRCQRKENLIKIAGFYESLGGDVVSLVDNSPISLLIDRIIDMSRPKVMKIMKPKKPLKKKTGNKKKRKSKNSGALTKEEIKFLELQIALDQVTQLHKLVSSIRKREEYKTLHTHISNSHFLSIVNSDKNSKIKVDSPLQNTLSKDKLTLGRPLNLKTKSNGPTNQQNFNDGTNLISNNVNNVVVPLFKNSESVSSTEEIKKETPIPKIRAYEGIGNLSRKHSPDTISRISRKKSIKKITEKNEKKKNGSNQKIKETQKQDFYFKFNF